MVEHMATLGPLSTQTVTSPIEQLGTETHRVVQSSSEQVQLASSRE
jgi:hypothetical protein